MPAMFCSACGKALAHPPPVTCAACGTGHWRNPAPCASGLVTLAGRLLLVRRAKDPWHGYWDGPGGFCEFTEHPMLTAAREVKEETRVQIRITGLLGMWMDEYGSDVDPASRKTTLNIYYHAVPIGEPQLEYPRDEVFEAVWFGPHELLEALAFPGHIVPVLQAWRVAYLANDLRSPLPDRPQPV